ncbi:CurL C-terminal domain-containing protein [Salinispora arenicola]|uniref:CurL C-terminal domain-containing protein n=1 Tax=Salinispora arenicola TaxID=168697 RepID=UPI003F5CF9E0
MRTTRASCRAPGGYRPRRARAEEMPLSLLPVTAHSAEALRDTCRELSNHVERNAAPWLPDLAYTLATRRTPLPHRIALVVRDRVRFARWPSAYLR